jgi:hypothetical protein
MSRGSKHIICAVLILALYFLHNVNRTDVNTAQALDVLSESLVHNKLMVAVKE